MNYDSDTAKKISKMLLREVLVLSVSFIAVRCFTTDDRSSMEESGRPSFEKYQAQRKKLLASHLGTALGADIELNEAEQQFNAILMDLKNEELYRGFLNPFNFTPARHFFDVLKSVESSPLFKLIRKMPKGIFLHKNVTQIKSLTISV